MVIQIEVSIVEYLILQMKFECCNEFYYECCDDNNLTYHNVNDSQQLIPSVVCTSALNLTLPNGSLELSLTDTHSSTGHQELLDNTVDRYNIIF